MSQEGEMKITFDYWPETPNQLKGFLDSIESHCRFRLEEPKTYNRKSLQILQRNPDPEDKSQWEPRVWEIRLSNPREA